MVLLKPKEQKIVKIARIFNKELLMIFNGLVGLLCLKNENVAKVSDQ